MNRDRTLFLFLNIGHFLDHLFTLIFATVAALALSREWGLGYGELLKYATPGFFAFGLFSLPAGWLADKWSREGMISVFFIGIGLAAIATAFAATPLQVGIGLFVVGVFAAIYHPVGLAIVTQRWKNTGMRLAVNGVWGNLGVASAALVTGYFIDHGGWRAAFVVPGVVSIITGVIYTVTVWQDITRPKTVSTAPATAAVVDAASHRALLLRISAIVFLTTSVSSIVFQSTTFALPKIFDERLQGTAQALADWLNTSGLTARADVATMVGAFAFTVFAVASMAQLAVGHLLDRHGPRVVFLGAAAMQLVFFALMPGLHDGLALAVALGFMLGAFGQIPINDYMVGKMASGEARARIYGVRYVVSFTALATALPLISIVYERWGFDTLFKILAGAAFVVLLAVSFLPARLPKPAVAGA
ncbi:MFS transporter [Bradyrhizobium sp. U87765 SZCCT0131]|uniref:MFS transporter n=1 Tax=unclassified Bradyrhizobium TaxID=2631580 RepID=UPI001BAA94AA|nr:MULTISPECIES: MFS transporter [unclassified Bradyrhizobium]MBR1219854.1 MFS transporter [Bradyrhizobium sp. U87765 SZCCT0131]MBR1262505.1 MFS transporter [Bradyrhizobium sp. U87765 SZCCT0134]MBR1308312.1 MFS transporter [Bradyrhizobium sp. U87765 SZCCT0110]MBR1318287.1 MFS transporter [Bradyrhizobium sp. U87765 SZCCT0109]MBR1351990.1 MFS transporter [Bradyrhizobium sp. U87765 SZCCT0048]